MQTIYVLWGVKAGEKYEDVIAECASRAELGAAKAKVDGITDLRVMAWQGEAPDFARSVAL